MALRCSTERLSSVVKNRKAVMYHKEKICVLDKLQSGRGCTVHDKELMVNESTIYMK